MQAIILAAGMGKRLGDLTKDNTKCMIKVNGTYLIDRLLSQLDSLNLERIILVIGYQGEKLRTHIEKQSRNAKPIADEPAADAQARHQRQKPGGKVSW